MTLLAFDTRAAPYREITAPAPETPTRRQRLAIVVTGGKLCGIAAYAAALRRQLTEAFDVTVFELDQYLLRNLSPRVRTLADEHVKDICRQIADFDAVNLQLEYGTLGHHQRDIYRRFPLADSSSTAVIGHVPYASDAAMARSREPYKGISDAEMA